MATDRAPSDEELIGAVLAGDQSAYGPLVLRYQSLVYRTLYWLSRDADETEDLTQEVFVRAYFALPTHDRSRPLAPWLLTIARNLCFTASRRKRHEVPAEEGEKILVVARDAAPSPASAVEGHDLRRRIWHAMGALPDEFRQVILLRHVSELSYEEICQATGLPIGTVKSRLNRGRRMLARELAEER